MSSELLKFIAEIEREKGSGILTIRLENGVAVSGEFDDGRKELIKVCRKVIKHLHAMDAGNN